MSPNPKTMAALQRIGFPHRDGGPLWEVIAEALEAGEIPGYPGEMEYHDTDILGAGPGGGYRQAPKEATGGE